MHRTRNLILFPGLWVDMLALLAGSVVPTTSSFSDDAIAGVVALASVMS